MARRIGVVGAGTMGWGIAQLGCLGGFETVLHDPIGEALESGSEKLRAALAKGAERGRWSADEAAAATSRLLETQWLESLDGCELVIEAAPERLELKRELFAELERGLRRRDGARDQHLLPVSHGDRRGPRATRNGYAECISSTRRR